jgi:hypothetical protein
MDSPAAPAALLAHGVSGLCCLIACPVTDSIASVECDRKAAQARDPNAAKEFQSLAARWRVAAATRDFNHKVEVILRKLREAASL